MYKTVIQTNAIASTTHSLTNMNLGLVFSKRLFVNNNVNRDVQVAFIPISLCTVNAD